MIIVIIRTLIYHRFKGMGACFPMIIVKIFSQFWYHVESHRISETTLPIPIIFHFLSKSPSHKFSSNFPSLSLHFPILIFSSICYRFCSRNAPRHTNVSLLYLPSHFPYIFTLSSYSLN